MTQTEAGLAIALAGVSLLLLHSLWRRYALGSLIRAMNKEMKRFHKG